jgi:imidazolonepropionase-like amidohydrolase
MLFITGATLIDGTGADPLPGAQLLVGDDGRISEVGTDLSRPADAELLDVGGATVMPGLIDAHVHLYSGRFGTNMQERALTPPSLHGYESMLNARETLEAGVTSVRDASGTPAGFRMAIEQGIFPGPRMKLSISALSQTGGHGDGLLPAGIRMGRPGHPAEVPETLCDGVEEVRKAARLVLRAGADFIKLHSTGGVLSPSDEPGSTQFTVEEIAVMVQEAAAQGKTCMAHAQATQGIKNAVLAGVESIEHGIYLDDEVIAQMKQRGTFLVPTLHAPRGVLKKEEERPGTVLPQSLRKTHEVLQAHTDSIRAAHETGVRIAMGTDAAVGKHGTNAEELEYLTQIGMSPMEAIVASTKTAAECIHDAANVGTLEPGKLADLLVIDGNPLDDITILQDRDRLRAIVLGGKPYKDTIRS